MVGFRIKGERRYGKNLPINECEASKPTMKRSERSSRRRKRKRRLDLRLRLRLRLTSLCRKKWHKVVSSSSILPLPLVSSRFEVGPPLEPTPTPAAMFCSLRPAPCTKRQGSENAKNTPACCKYGAEVCSLLRRCC